VKRKAHIQVLNHSMVGLTSPISTLSLI